jgi:hypothetical protein
MEMDQATNQSTKTLKDLFSNPSELLGIITNPRKNGVDFIKSLSGKDKQYLAFAAGIGLIVYGIVLNRKND